MQIRSLKWKTIPVWPPEWSITDQDMAEEGILEQVQLRNDPAPGLIIVKANHLGDSRIGIIILDDYAKLNFLFHILQDNIGKQLTEIGNLTIDMQPSPPKYGVKQVRPQSQDRILKQIVPKK